MTEDFSEVEHAKRGKEYGELGGLKIRKSETLSILLLSLGCLALAGGKLSSCFGPGVFQSWDLHAHVVLVSRLRLKLSEGHFTFFDPWWFGGWSAFSYYAPLAHISTAVLSAFLAALGSSEPDQSAVQGMLGVLLAGLPLTLYFCVRKILRSQDLVFNPYALSGLSFLFGIWFLRHPDEHFGIGVNGAISLGLFPQVFAWHLLLLYSAELFTGSRTRFPFALCCLLALLNLTHSLTFLAAAAFGFSVLLWRRAKKELWFAHLLGIGLSAFWFLPATKYGGDFCPADKVRSVGGLVSLLFPETFALQGRRLLSGEIFSLSFLPVVFVFGLSLLISEHWRSSEEKRRKSQVSGILGLAFVLCLLLTSEYFALSLPVSLHLYRILVLFLLLMLLLLLIPLTLWISEQQRFLFLMGILVLLCFQEFCLFSPVPSFGVRAKEFAAENLVLQELRRADAPSPSEGRVFVEHLGRPDRPEIRSPHYISSRLQADSGREAATGLFVQSSLSQAYPAFATKRLKIHSYNSRQPIGLSDHAETAQLFGRLREFGVNTLVLDAGDDESGRPQGGTLVGNYRILRLDAGENQASFSQRKELLGYHDAQNTFPFREFEAFFYGIDPLWQRFSLLSIEDPGDLPPGLAGLVVNGEVTSLPADVPRVAFQQLKENLLSIPLSWGRADELEFRRDEKLIEKDKVVEKIISIPSTNNEGELFPPITFLDATQEIQLPNVVPGKFYRVNYSYAPFWKADGGRLFRGDAERMWVRADSTNVLLRYRPWSSPWVKAGAFLSVLSGVLLLTLRLRNRQGYTS